MKSQASQIKDEPAKTPDKKGEQRIVVSSKLTEKYHLLEKRVNQLMAELAVLRQERKHNIHEKAELVERLQALLHNLPAGILLLDKFGTIEQFNPAAKELLNEPLEGEAWLSVINREFVHSEVAGNDIVLRSGKTITISTCSLGTHPGQILLLQDQTENRNLERRLSHLQRLTEMGKMVASLAHQIRTPLAAAILYAANLESQDLEPKMRDKFTTKLKSRLNNIEKQIKDMLLFARNDGDPNLEPVLLSEITQGIEQAAEDISRQSHVTFHCKLEIPDQTIQCNKETLISAIQNCINNSSESTTENVIIDVIISQPQNDRIEIKIADNGSGMTPDNLKKALEPFYTTRSQGTGLGLAVAQAVAQSHGGELWIKSEVDKGTQVGFRLPIASEEKQ